MLGFVEQVKSFSPWHRSRVPDGDFDLYFFDDLPAGLYDVRIYPFVGVNLDITPSKRSRTFRVFEGEQAAQVTDCRVVGLLLRAIS